MIFKYFARNISLGALGRCLKSNFAQLTPFNFLQHHLKSSKGCLKGLEAFNPLSPDMRMHILLTVLHTFLMELVTRIYPNIMARPLILGDGFLYSHQFNV